MLSWSTIAYGAGLSAAAAAVLTYVASRRLTITVAALIAATAGPAGWNAVLRATHAREFFTDAPITVMPASWQDAGSGVAILALAATLIGLGPLARDGRRAIALAAAAGTAAFLVDVYLY
jgi:hypothetical protein